MTPEEKAIVDILNNSSLTITSDGKPLTVITKEYSLIASEIVTKVKNLVKPDVSSSFCDCISTIGVDGERYGKWTCRSCKKEVPNKNRKY